MQGSFYIKGVNEFVITLPNGEPRVISEETKSAVIVSRGETPRECYNNARFMWGRLYSGFIIAEMVEVEILKIKKKWYKENLRGPSRSPSGE